MNDNCWLKDYCNKKDCNSFCMKNYKLNALYNKAMISMHQRKHILLSVDDDRDIQAFDTLKNIETNIVDFVNNGKNLFIHSSTTGNGKTAWSLRMIEAYFNSIWSKTELKCRALFISVPRFLIELKQNISKESDYVKQIQESMFDCDIIIWDDIATKLGTEFELSNLFSIIDTRINNGKSNIFTSNLCGQDLCTAIGERLYSRIANYCDYDIELFGSDKRSWK